MHPHRGIETFTYLLEGTIEHADSLGNKGVITAGSAQWMTAGSGILHQEMPQASKRLAGLQLWVNLPRADKMTAPAYRDIDAASVPKVSEPAADVAVVAGSYKGADGAAQGDFINVTLLDVTIKPGQTWSVPTKRGDTLFLYMFSGECRFAGEESVVSKQAVLFNDGDVFSVTGGPEESRFVLVSGKPLHEPVEWGGPIVMNTAEELRAAFDELHSGTFIRS